MALCSQHPHGSLLRWFCPRTLSERGQPSARATAAARAGRFLSFELEKSRQRVETASRFARSSCNSGAAPAPLVSLVCCPHSTRCGACRLRALHGNSTCICVDARMAPFTRPARPPRFCTRSQLFGPRLRRRGSSPAWVHHERQTRKSGITSQTPYFEKHF